MHVAHSNIETTSLPAPTKQMSEFAIRMVVKRYNRTCKINADRITAIQKHFPGWKPEFKLMKQQ